MRRVLVPCSMCSRHGFVDEGACPFCGGELTTPRALPGVSSVTRAAMVAGTIAIVGCGPAGGKQPQPQPTPSAVEPEPDPGSPVAEYGAPAPDKPVERPTEPEPDPGSPVAEYGAPAPDQR